jgi:hypothetical protein
MFSAVCNQQDERASVRIAAFQDGAEAAVSFRLSDQSRGLDLRRQSLGHQAVR